MSPLRQQLRRPELYLAVVALVLALGVFDSFRAPERQLSARAYVATVRGFYQPVLRPGLEGRVRCRYRPSCSEYSIEAVERHGIRRGLLLTASRLASCTSAVAPGTDDPVPGR